MSDSLALLIRSGIPLVSIETTDEIRAVELVLKVATELKRPLYEWSMTGGLSLGGKTVNRIRVAKSEKPQVALKHIAKSPESAIYLFKDLGPHCKDALIHRMVRNLIPICEEQHATIVMIDALPLSEEIKPFTVRFEMGWPDAEELEQVVVNTFKRIKSQNSKEVTLNIKKREMEQLVQSLRGLSCSEAEHVIASAIYQDYQLSGSDLPHIVETKRTLLGSTGCLESIAADVDIDDVGGLDNLKGWLKQRRGAFSRKAKEFGLESPRGVLMLGVPGCGKSLCAKVVAADWRMPLLRLDPGVLYQKYIGASESQLRQALAQAEAMAPCVLWIDEIEKAFASATASSADGGLSKRMFGTLLSWMQDHRHPIFIVATANDISSLPPELMRKGRFDEVFFIDLPTQKAREQILKIHLQRRDRNPKEFDLRAISALSEGFTGSELEQAIISALFSAYSEKTELTDRHIIAEFGKTRPLSVLMGERVTELRQWAESRCVPAD